MSFFDKMFDDMSNNELVCRLPGELAFKALKRKVTNLESMFKFVMVSNTIINIIEVKNYFNDIIANNSIDDALEVFKDKHALLFSICNEQNRKRLKDSDNSKKDYKLLFNCSNAKDADELHKALLLVLESEEIKQSAIISILHKADQSVIPRLVNVITKDKRPEVRCSLLYLGSVAKRRMLDSAITLMALKALGQSSIVSHGIDKQKFSVFCDLQPEHRIPALKAYLNLFVQLKPTNPFDDFPTEEMINIALFAGAIDNVCVAEEIKKLYDEIKN